MDWTADLGREAWLIAGLGDPWTAIAVAYLPGADSPLRILRGPDSGRALHDVPLGYGPNELASVGALANVGAEWYVHDWRRSRVAVLNVDGTVVREWITQATPNGRAAFDQAGRIIWPRVESGRLVFYADSNGVRKRWRRVGSRKWETPAFATPYAIGVDGTLSIFDEADGCILRMTREEESTRRLCFPPPVATELRELAQAVPAMPSIRTRSAGLRALSMLNDSTMLLTSIRPAPSGWTALLVNINAMTFRRLSFHLRPGGTEVTPLGVLKQGTSLIIWSPYLAAQLAATELF
ncbi:MAG: hypothetical protein U0974_12820 [Gemmatimonadales bacterium]|nr:hypothetical protein [Gemmatimonadales bacterium]MDZ4390600.1 hypothetical protein [Gemmatimonadales bacterium]